MPSFERKRAPLFDERLIYSDEGVAPLDSKLAGLYKLSLRIVGPGTKIKKQ
jgi:hypothetical protein